MEPSVESYFMVDYSNAEIAALEEQFPKSFVYICDFHRLQGMHRWCKSKKNGFSSAEQEIFFFWLYEEHHLC